MGEEAVEEAAVRYGDRWLALIGELETELKRTGYSQRVAATDEDTPMPPSISKMGVGELRELYDRYIASYDYLSDIVGKHEAKMRIAAKRVEAIHAAVTKETTALKSKLTNAELRKSYVVGHPEYQAALEDHTFFKVLFSTQNRRLEKVAKLMEAVSREIWFRTQQANPKLAKVEGNIRGVEANLKKLKKDHFIRVE